MKALYKTCWEVSQRAVIEMAADRGPFVDHPFVDQSQSMNIHMQEPTMGKITSMHFAGWKLGMFLYNMEVLQARPLKISRSENWNVLFADDGCICPNPVYRRSRTTQNSG